MTPQPTPPSARPAPPRLRTARHARAAASRPRPRVAVPARAPGVFERHGRWLLVACALLSLVAHEAVRVGITSLPGPEAKSRKQVEKVEFAVVKKPPPPPEPVPEPPKPPEPKKIVKMEKAPPKPLAKMEAPPPPADLPPPPPDAAPPPPNEEAKSVDPSPPPIIAGLNNLSFTNGPSNLTVTRGNTMYGAPSQVGARAEDVKPYKAERYSPSYQLSEMPSCDPLDGAAFRKEYPEEAKRAEVEGRVLMKLVIDDDGSIAKVVVTKDPGYGLGRAAERIVRNMKCRPGKQNGQVVATEIPFTLTFELDSY